MLYWTMFYTVILNLTPATWCVIAAPLVILILLIAVGRKSVATLRSEGVWRTLGRKWGQIGLCVLGAALVAYASDVTLAYCRAEYNQKFGEVLRQRTSKIGSVNVRKTLVRKAAERLDETQLRDMANTYAATLAPEQRLPFLNSFCSSEIDKGLINFGPLLAAKPGNASEPPNLALDTTLPFDAAQMKLYEARSKSAPDKSAFWACLRVEQWRFICKQMFFSQSPDAMVDILTNLVSEMDANESVRLTKALLDSQYAGTRNLAVRLANEAGVPNQVWLFNMLITGVAWLRGALWLALWLAVGLTMVSQAGRMKASQRLFQVQRQ